jgi:hypothetical protein
MKKSFLVLTFVFAIVSLLTTDGIAGEGKKKGKEKIEVCHITGTYDFGEGDVPIGHVISIAEPAYEAHIKHGDPEVWEVVTLPDGKEVCTSDMDHVTSNQSDYGKPYKVKINQVDDTETNIAFGLITDTHIDMSNCLYEHDKTVRARDVARCINIDCANAGCLGVIHMGDITNGNNTQYVVAFRQIFENNYPGHDGGAIAGCWPDDGDKCHDCYSKGSRIRYPVFPTLGNHDDPPFSSGDENWRKAQNYIEDRIIGASHLLDRYKEVNYVWRWGQYVFIQLGKWAGSYEHEDSGATDPEKIAWLRKVLKKEVGNSGLGVFIFQHYGWDGFSKEDRWWNDTQRKLEINVLCRRTNSNSTCVPYNVLAFITGHNHAPKFETIEAGKDSEGNDVKFDNYVMQSSGAAYGDYDKYGFSIMHLDGDSLTMRTKECKYNNWSTHEKDFTLGIKDKPDSFRFTVGRDLQSNGTTDRWDSMIYRPFSGNTEFGGGAAFSEIDHNTSDINTSDIVLVGIDSQPGAKRFYYRIGYNLLDTGNFSSWGSVKYSPYIGWLTAGGGAAVADIDGNGEAELVLMYVDAPSGADQFRYMIGWNLDTEGNPTHWSGLVHGPSPGSLTAGGGAAISNIDGNGRPDLLLMAIDNPDGANQFRYTIGWNLDTNGNPESWSDIVHGPSPGSLTAGGGADIADIDGNGRPDLLLMSIDNPDGPNQFRYTIGWNLDINGNPESWSDIIHCSSPGYRTTGAGAAIIEDAGYSNLLLMAIDDPLGQE